jgi:ferritin-like protein
LPGRWCRNAGVEVDKLVDMLVRNTAPELATCYFHTILRVNLIGLQGEGLKEITEDARSGWETEGSDARNLTLRLATLST